jgi:hypothetical protein
LIVAGHQPGCFGADAGCAGNEIRLRHGYLRIGSNRFGFDNARA